MRRFIQTLFALVLLALPLPALADVSGYYTNGEEAFVVRVADSGAFVMQSGKLTLIGRGGVAYAVIALPDGGSVITEFSALMALIREPIDAVRAQMPATPGLARAYRWIEGDPESVAGIPGRSWRLAPVDSSDTVPEMLDDSVVVTRDPAIAPLGAAFAMLVREVAPMIMPFAAPGLGALMAELFVDGAPLRLGDALMLDHYDVETIDSALFELPGPVVDAETAWAQLQAADG